LSQRFLILSALFLVVGALPAGAQRNLPTIQTSSDTKVMVKSFRPKNVIGLLGHPLGTVVRVSGIVVDGNSPRVKALDGKTLLRIETVNGSTLGEPATFQFGRAARDIKEPQPGERFDFFVHEHGAFDGVVDPPRELNIDHPNFAHDGFYYRPAITIHKSNREQPTRK
jgi:hypothetical protein